MKASDRIGTIHTYRAEIAAAPENEVVEVKATSRTEALQKARRRSERKFPNVVAVTVEPNE